MKIDSIELKITLSDGEEATASIDADGNIFRGGSYDAMCNIVEATEAIQAALFNGGFMYDEERDMDDED